MSITKTIMSVVESLANSPIVTEDNAAAVFEIYAKLATKAAKATKVTSAVAQATNGICEIARGVLNIARACKTGFEAMNTVANEVTAENADLLARADVSKNADISKP
jgi:hypothetical protein